MNDTLARDGKKGFWAAIWESMTKTGGCCGSGGDCCGPSRSPGGDRKPQQSVAIGDRCGPAKVAYGTSGDTAK